MPLSALAANEKAQLVAAGVENPENGLGETPIFIWYVSIM
jgi:hypothetical protein